MNGLKKYNIERLSYSTLSNFRERPDLWFLNKICGYKFPSNPAMKRGNYVEEGIHAYLSEKGNIKLGSPNVLDKIKGIFFLFK